MDGSPASSRDKRYRELTSIDVLVHLTRGYRSHCVTQQINSVYGRATPPVGCLVFKTSEVPSVPGGFDSYLFRHITLGRFGYFGVGVKSIMNGIFLGWRSGV